MKYCSTHGNWETKQHTWVTWENLPLCPWCTQLKAKDDEIALLKAQIKEFEGMTYLALESIKPSRHNGASCSRSSGDRALVS